MKSATRTDGTSAGDGKRRSAAKERGSEREYDVLIGLHREPEQHQDLSETGIGAREHRTMALNDRRLLTKTWP